MANGFAALGEMLAGGGGASRENAFYEGQAQRAKVEHLSAQTLNALEQAKVRQMEAKKFQLEEDARDGFAESAMALGLAKDGNEAKAYANFMVGGAANLQQAVGARGGLQEQGFRATLADHKLPLADRLGASSGIEGKPVSPFVNIPEESVNALDPAIGSGAPNVLQTPKGVANTNKAATAPVRAPSPYRIDPATGELTFRRGGPADPEVIAANERAKGVGRGQAKRTMDLPQARARLGSFNQKQSQLAERARALANDEDLWKGTGVFNSVAEIPGTQGRRIAAQMDTLLAKLAVQAVQEARDLSKTGGAYGNTNAREWADLGQSYAAVNRGMHPDDLRKELLQLASATDETRLRSEDAFYETYPEVSRNGGTAKTDFANVAEAEAAGLPPGTRITIGGRAATVEAD